MMVFTPGQEARIRDLIREVFAEQLEGLAEGTAKIVADAGPIFARLEEAGKQFEVLVPMIERVLLNVKDH